MADLGELVVRIRADAAQLESELKRVQGVTQDQTSKMTKSFRSLHDQLIDLAPAFSLAALVAFGRSAIEQADHINDLGQRIGFVGSTLSALNIPLRQSGSNLDEFAGAMVRMNNALGEAKNNPQMIKTFDDLHLSITKLEQLSPEEQFNAIAQALNGIDNQSQFTSLGINIFGRSFAVLAPLIRQAGGDMKAFTEEQKKAGNALTDEQLKRIDEFGDKWTETVEKLKLSMTDALPALQLYLDGLAGILNLPGNAVDFGRQIGLAINGNLPSNVSRSRPNTVDAATVVSGYTLDAKGNLVKANQAAGTNAGLLKSSSDAKKQEAEDYDKVNDSLDEYIRKMEMENDLIGLNERDRKGMEAVMEAQNLAMKDGNILTEEQIAKIKGLSEAQYDLSEKMRDAETDAKRMRENLVDGLTDIALHFDNAGDAAKKFFETIASQILTKKLTTPIADAAGGLLNSLIGGIGKGGIGQVVDNIGAYAGLNESYGPPMQGYASGGRPPLGVPSIVGENGPELFVPDTAGTVVPNGKLGGGSVNVSNTWNIGDGVTHAQLASLIPYIEQRTRASVFAEIERGGKAASIVGRKS
ncbi:hypothetical protein [Zavarzinella formosa]|uniref:hypothetical protein n=1 Tax=Zavarzinella formosa TaxID=360055 RepID=UPI0002F0C440|nr:hypothetical protein [Zavarzinella formosa]